MTTSGLPGDGELRLGPVLLPVGKRVFSGRSGTPVAWVTIGPVPDPGRVWSALFAASPVTGLVPFLLETLDEEDALILADEGWPGPPTGDVPGRPWDIDAFGEPADIVGLDQIDAAELLAKYWDDCMPSAEEDEETDDPRTMRAPFSRKFPGTAPAQKHRLNEEVIQRFLDSLPPARIGLAAATRPADVLPLIGWPGGFNRFPTGLPIAAVLRSWEDRFGPRCCRSASPRSACSSGGHRER
jgi:hypothetical protein